MNLKSTDSKRLVSKKNNGGGVSRVGPRGESWDFVKVGLDTFLDGRSQLNHSIWNLEHRDTEIGLSRKGRSKIGQKTHLE